MKFKAYETVYSQPTRVDREKGILFGCKLLGKESKNGREYTRKALESAARLYGQLGVDLDHQKDPKSERSLRDLIGIRPQNVHVTKEGVFADIHLLLSDPQSAKILEAADRDPCVFGFSHEADLTGTRSRTGKVQVESVTRVHSLDMVRHPATTKGAFESMNDETHITEAEEEAAPESCKELLARAMVLAEKEGDVELAQKIHKLIKPEKGEEGAEEEEEAEVEEEEANDEKESVQRKVDLESVKILAKRYGVEENFTTLIKPEATMLEILTVFESWRPAKAKKLPNVEQGTPLPEENKQSTGDRFARFMKVN